MEAVSQQEARKIAAIESGAALFDVLLFHFPPLAWSIQMNLSQPVRCRAARDAVLDVEDNRLRFIASSIAARLFPFGFHGLQLRACLFPVANRVVGAERDLLAARQQKLFTALHQVLLVEGPRVHEV